MGRIKEVGGCDVEGAQRVGAWAPTSLLRFPAPRAEGTHARPGPWKLVSGPKMAAGRRGSLCREFRGDGRPKGLCKGLELTQASVLYVKKQRLKRSTSKATHLPYFRFEEASLHSLFQRRFKSLIKSIKKTDIDVSVSTQERTLREHVIGIEDEIY